MISSSKMLKKIRQLINDLKKAGFVNRGGKRSHRNFVHSSGMIITISGREGDDAAHYKEKNVKRVLIESKK